MEMDQQITIRPLRGSDSRRIWEIRNRQTVRENSLNPELISYKKHLQWINRYFNSKNICWVIEKNGAVAGYCRYDFGINEYTVSIAIDSQYIRQGLGNVLLSTSLKEISKDVPIKSIVKKNNLASVQLFTKNNFVLEKESGELLQFKYRSFTG